MHTSQIDYNIKLNTIEKIESIIKNKFVDVYIAKWRKYQKVCVKQICNSDEANNELNILSKCMHPKIVQCLGVSEDDDFTYIFFEYMENGNLEDYIQKVKLDPKKKLQIMIDVAIGLHYLHNRSPDIILHRDLKPANILINTHGSAKISDFGISKLVDSKCSSIFSGHTGEIGTYVWMSPEVLKHEYYNFKSDIYSLGLIMYYIWTEKKPFEELKMNTIQLMFAKFQDKLHISIDNNIELNELVQKCCSFDKETRPSSEEVIDILSNLIM